MSDDICELISHEQTQHPNSIKMADSSFGNISSASVSRHADDSEYHIKPDSVDNQTTVRFESSEESKIEGASNSISMRVFPKSMTYQQQQSKLRHSVANGTSTESILQNFCQYCFHAFAKPKILQKHQRQFHYIVDGEVKRFCAICSKSFIKICYKNEEEFLEHAASLHGIRIHKDESGQIIDVVGVEGIVKRRPYKKRINNSSDKRSEKKAKNGGKVSTATTKTPEKSARQSNVESIDQIRVKMEIEDEEEESFHQSSETGTSAWRAIVKAECTDLDMDDAVNIKDEPSDDHFDM